MKKTGLIIFTVLAIALAIILIFFPKLLSDNGQAVSDQNEQEEKAAKEFFSRLQDREAILLGQAGLAPAVQRDGRNLIISTSSGKKIDLKDCLNCGPEKDVEHYFIERITDPAAVLIYRQYYEADNYAMILSDGTILELPAYPVFSPDKKSFIVVSAAEAFNWNGIEVWEKDGDHFSRRLRFEPQAAEMYRFLSWDGNDHAKLEFTRQEREDNPQPVCQGAELKREGRSWTIKALQGVVREGPCPHVDDWVPVELRRGMSG